MTKDSETARRDRLKVALRENLKRRKAQIRARSEPKPVIDRTLSSEREKS